MGHDGRPEVCRGRPPLIAVCHGLRLSPWAGLIVLDSYTYLLLTLVLAVGYDLVGANALKAISGIGFAVAAIVLFADQVEVEGSAGSIMSVGGITGAWLGAKLAAVERSKVWVFRLLVSTIVGEIVHLIWR